MHPAALSPEARTAALHEMRDGRELDILVVGGGVVGSGAALDAAARGLRVGLVEARDWASGTSSRSSKLMHGGLRYLEMLDFALVREALRERGLSVGTLAPYLVQPVPFLYPLQAPRLGAALRRRRHRALRRHGGDVRARGRAAAAPPPVPTQGAAGGAGAASRTRWSAR